MPSDEPFWLPIEEVIEINRAAVAAVGEPHSLLRPVGKSLSWIPAFAGMTMEGTRHARARPAHLPPARDGRIKSGHDAVGEARSEAFAGMTVIAAFARMTKKIPISLKIFLDERHAVW